jgi:hypothetical protein
VAPAPFPRQADEIATMATAAIRKLGMRKLELDVVLGGGVFRNDWSPFFERIDDGVHAVAPSASIVRLTAPPVAGAAMLGLDLLGATRSAHRRAKEHLTHARIATQTADRKER